MTNKIKEISLIFWGSLAICFYIADSFEWIDICKLFQQVFHYGYTYDEITRMVFPFLFTALALFGITQIILVSCQMGQTSIPTFPDTERAEIKLLPSLAAAPSRDNYICADIETATINDKFQHIRERHLHEQSVLQQQALEAVQDYIFRILPPFMKNKDIEVLYQNVELWQFSQEATLQPVVTNGKLSTLDLRHLAWNIGERLKWAGELRALFIKQSFPNELRDSDISSIRRNLRQQGDCVITIDIPDKHDFQFHE